MDDEAKMTVRCEEDFMVKLEGENVKLQKVEGKRKRRKKHGVHGSVWEWRMEDVTIHCVSVTMAFILHLSLLSKTKKEEYGKTVLQ